MIYNYVTAVGSAAYSVVSSQSVIAMTATSDHVRPDAYTTHVTQPDRLSSTCLFQYSLNDLVGAIDVVLTTAVTGGEPGLYMYWGSGHVSRPKVNVDLYSASLSLNNLALMYDTCYTRVHSFTCHQTRAIPAFTPSHRASPPFGRYF